MKKNKKENNLKKGKNVGWTERKEKRQSDTGQEEREKER